jgi:hypothetical protein
MKKQMLLLLLCGLAFLPDGLQAQSGIPEPPCIIYKTKKNYDANVAVGLSEDKSRIVSYPHPRDVFTHGELCTPVRLARKFRLDRRGIGPNVAFLSITYEEYSQLATAPSLDELESMIIDRNPIKKMYRCDVSAPEQHIDDLNRLIRRRCKTFERLVP